MGFTGGVALSGSGSLTITLGSSSQFSVGIWSSTACAITGGTITITSGTTTGDSNAASLGIQTGALSIQNATVTTNGGAAYPGQISWGLSASSMNVKNSTVIATGNSQAVQVGGSVVLNGSSILAGPSTDGTGATSVSNLTGQAGYKYVKISAPLSAATVTFVTAGPIAKLTTDAAFTNVATGNGTGAITYSSGTPGTATVDANGEVTILAVGSTVITATQAADTTYAAGTATYTLNVTAPAGQAAPTGLTGVAPTSALNDGEITGTTALMQYKLASADDAAYVTCTVDQAGLAAGDYVVRLAATTGFNAGATAVVTVPAYVAPTTTYTVTFRVIAAGGTLGATVDSGVIASGDLVVAGKGVVFTAITDSSHQVKEWTVNTVVVAGNTTNTLTVSSLAAATAVTVEFEEIQPTTYAVTFSVTGANGTLGATVDSVAIATGDLVVATKDVVFTAVPASSYQVKAWTVDGTVVEVDTTTGLTVAGRTAATAVTVEFEAIPSNADQSAPTGLIGVAPTTSGGTDGSITGTTIAMEYELATGGTYAACSATTTTVGAAGDYVVRLAAAPGYNAGATTAVTVPTYTAPTTTTYTVTFDTQGGLEAIDPETGIVSGAFAILPPNPTKDGFTFAGWFTATTGGTAFTAATTVTADVTVYAQWTVTYVPYYPVTPSPSPAPAPVPTPSPAPAPVPVPVKNQTVLILQIGKTMFWDNSIPTKLDSTPVIKNSRTLLPIRAIIEALGGTVAWDPIAHKVTVTLGTKTVVLWIGKSLATVNGVSTPIDATDASVVPEIINSRTMLPLRFVSENLGCTVLWAAATQTITITYTP